MKIRPFSLLAVACAAMFALAGCSNRDIDTAKVRAALQSISEGPKARLETALSDIDAGKYKDALQPLRNVAYGAKLDKKQRKIIEDTIAKVRARIAKGE